MPRRNRPKPASQRPLPAGLGGVRTESARDGDWHLRSVPAGHADKAYRCPGCAQLIQPGTPHVVAWPTDPGGAQDRRHWHTACWAARRHRGPT